MARLEGPAVQELNVVFATDWFTETGENLQHLAAEVPPAPSARPGALTGVGVQVVPSGPGFATENNLRLFNAMLYSAERRLSLTSPYFVPDDSLLQALKSAALRGVETHLVVSTVADQFMVSRAQHSYYAELLAAGVRIHTFHAPTLLHAKHISIDDDIAAIGSSNMDRRSFELDLEVMLLIYDRAVVRSLQAIEAGYFRHAAELAPDEWQRRPLYEQVLDNTLRLLSAIL
jgi:cardiolipin synthase